MDALSLEDVREIIRAEIRQAVERMVNEEWDIALRNAIERAVREKISVSVQVGLKGMTQ